MTCEDTTPEGIPLPKWPHPKWHQEVNNALARISANGGGGSGGSGAGSIVASEIHTINFNAGYFNFVKSSAGDYIISPNFSGFLGVSWVNISDINVPDYDVTISPPSGFTAPSTLWLDDSDGMSVYGACEVGGGGSFSLIHFDYNAGTATEVAVLDGTATDFDSWNSTASSANSLYACVVWRGTDVTDGVYLVEVDATTAAITSTYMRGTSGFFTYSYDIVGNYLYIVENGDVEIWDITTQTLLDVISPSGGTLLDALVLSESGTTVLAINMDTAFGYVFDVSDPANIVEKYITNSSAFIYADAMWSIGDYFLIFGRDNPLVLFKDADTYLDRVSSIATYGATEWFNPGMMMDLGNNRGVLWSGWNDTFTFVDISTTF